MKNVTVHFFAVFREATGVESLSLETGAETAMELFTEMTSRFSRLNHEAAALVAINDDMSRWDDVIAEGDKILFFPPVAGG
jgi:molybdopterin converting factor small subunit